jgi:hypothetical protein
VLRACIGAKSAAALLTIVLSLLSVCACSRPKSPEAKRPNVDQAQEVEPEQPEIKAATPEDPGPTATVVIPLEVLKKRARGFLQTNPEAGSPEEPLPIDHPVYLESQKPKNLLHKVFSVNNHTQFTFVVPPHQGNARLRGTFRSFTKRSDPDSTSDRNADVDLMLLSDQEFNEFLHGQPQSVTYELDPSHDQMVDWRVPTTYGESQTYHLVFCNSPGGTKIKFVEANFSVIFE